MTISKRQEVTQTVYPSGLISVLTTTVLEEDGTELARTNHREVLEPGDATAGRPAAVAAVAAAAWTPAVLTAHAQRKAAREAAPGPR